MENGWMVSFLMYFQLDSPLQRWWVFGLLIAWGSLLFGGFAFGKTNTEGTRRMPTWTRMGSSFALVIAGWSWYLFVQDGPVGGFALLIAIGMTLGCVGDLFLARLFPLPQPTLWGIGAFGLGHVMYIAALVSFGNQNGLMAPGQVWGAWIGWLLIGLLGWYFMVFRGQKPTLLHWAALPYALLLASTAGFAWGLALQTSVFVPMAIGAALFLLSDLILAAELFNGLRFRLIGDVVWLTYGPAQALIVYGVNSALLVVGHR
jgi:YhhN family